MLSDTMSIASTVRINRAYKYRLEPREAQLAFLAQHFGACRFIYNYFLRLGFLDGREGLLLHLYHAVYVSWKYAKAWELARSKEAT